LWGVIAILLYCTLFENLIQLVNIIGSIFYGTVLEDFLVGFISKCTIKAIFFSAVISQLTIFIIYYYAIYIFPSGRKTGLPMVKFYRAMLTIVISLLLQWTIF
jgi:hypothetical protein